MALPDPSVLRAADLITQGKSAQAEPVLRRHLQKHAGDPDGCRLLALALLNTGRADQAEFFARRAMDLAPSAAACDALGTTLVVLAKLDEAVAAFQRGITLDASLPSLHNGLGGALLNSRRYDESAQAFARARALAPGSVIFWRQHAAALVRAHRADEAIALLREGCGVFPEDLILRTQLVSTLNYADVPALDRLEHSRALGRLFDRAGGKAPTFANTRDPARRLRVGLLSGDWFDHPVAHFISPLFTHRPAGLDLYVYDASRKRDHINRRLRPLAQAWREVDRLGDAAVAARMRADGIDLAVDLGGHTIDSRVAVMAFHPAPVGVAYPGYPGTTGMSSVGWRLVDHHTDPPGADAWHTERLAHLDPCFLCFPPPEGAPEVAAPPAGRDGPITFGSFNNPSKLSASVLQLWARVLGATPGSTLLLKGVGFEVPAVRERLQRAAAEAGIDPTRLTVLPITATPAEHLATYARVDIALDTSPYHGTTTTCEALWMGVPVVTLAGETHVSRVGVSLLSAVGLPEWIAASPDAYLALASGLARDRAALAAHRGSLRGRMLASALCDQPGFASRFEASLRSAWRDWCARP